jgi:NADH-quinone oxidoreductase subunit E
MKMDISRPLTEDAGDEAMLEAIASSLAGFEGERSNLIPVLQFIQREHAYLSEEAIQVVAQHFRISASEVYGVATFYNQFRFHPPGKHQIRVCLGTACHVVGGDIILENFERKLGIHEGETTPDREFSIERVACVGCCALAPVAIVDESVQAHMAPSRVEGLLLGFEIEKDQTEREKLKDKSND